jgi:hypothetical protein
MVTFYSVVVLSFFNHHNLFDTSFARGGNFSNI